MNNQQPVSEDLPWSSIPQMLMINCHQFANNCAIEDGEKQLTYKQLYELFCYVSTRLASVGVKAGDRVIIWGPNSWRWVVAALASWWRGAIVVPVSAQAKMLEGAPLLERVRPSAVFVDESAHGTADQWEQLLDTPTTFSLRETGSSNYEALYPLADQPDLQSSTAEPAQVSPEDICEFLFTSGSTGTPKGVIRQHAQVIRNRHGSSMRRGFRSEDGILALSPFSHTLGVNGTLLRGLMLGARVVIARNLSPRGIASIIINRGITAISAPPSLYEILLDMEHSGTPLIRQLRLASVGAAAITEDLIKRLIEAGAGSIACGYGMTECESISSATSNMGAEIVGRTVGEPEAGLEVRIAGDKGLEQGSELPGEIQVRGYSTTPGYLDDPEATRALYTPDGWLRTGDIGQWTQAGYLQILGRKKEVINAHGYTLFPAEVEKLLLQSKMLQTVAAFGLTHVAGEVCAAAVVPLDPERFEVRKLMTWARQNMTAYKVPIKFYVVDQLPLNHNGKIDRKALKSQFGVGSED